MNRTISDNAQAEVSSRVMDIFRIFNVDDHQSQAHSQWQNPAERGWQDSKAWTNNILNVSGAPGYCWLLARIYVCFLQNHLALASLGWRTPTEWLLGFTPDISALLQFVFFEPVYYLKHEASFPSDTTECRGRFVGISVNVGHPMTFKILTAKNVTIHRAVVRTAVCYGPYKNLQADADAQIDDDEDSDVDTGPFKSQFIQDSKTNPSTRKFQ